MKRRREEEKKRRKRQRIKENSSYPGHRRSKKDKVLGKFV